MAASVGILAYRLPYPWRRLYLAGALAFFGVPLATGGTFTDLGHAIALGIGLLCRPLTRNPAGRKSVAANRLPGQSS
ncbi:rhomboid-like protein [Streptomyces sp. NPDC019890]|uniref:rhomboid-like protein n=1 Tax=Streptomyces sp. NPDC019890 TaxID=3365064 RepID=UPI0038506996